MRILDSKDTDDASIITNAPTITEYLTPFAADRHAAVCSGLDQVLVDCDCEYVINPRLVRGLDYYSHAAFEFVADIGDSTPSSSSSSSSSREVAVLAGGRYDGLAQPLGGPRTPAFGWAAGLERLCLLAAEQSALSSADDTDTGCSRRRLAMVLPVVGKGEAMSDDVMAATVVLARGLRGLEIPTLSPDFGTRKFLYHFQCSGLIFTLTKELLHFET